MSRHKGLNTRAPDERKAYIDFRKSTYRRGKDIGEQAYYKWQGIGQIKACPTDVMAHVAYIDETWQGINLLQGDLGMVDPDSDFTVDAQGYLICNGNQCGAYSIDQSTASLMYRV